MEKWRFSAVYNEYNDIMGNIQKEGYKLKYSYYIFD